MTAETNLLHVTQSGRLWTKDVWQRTAVGQKASGEREKGVGGGDMSFTALKWHIYIQSHDLLKLLWLKKLDSKFFTSKGGHGGISPRLAHHNKSQYISKSDYHVKLREDQQTSNAYTHYIYCISCE